MAELSQRDQLALHEFSVRYRAALAKENPAPEASIEAATDAVREQYVQEQEAEPGKEAAPSEARSLQREPPEPEQDR
jgi:hypothetical protein